MDIKNTIKKLNQTKFLFMFISQILVKLVNFCSGIILVRILSKHDYGVYSYVLNIINIFMLVEGLGSISGILQFGSEYYNRPLKKNAYINYGFKIGILSNTVLVVLIGISSMFVEKNIEGSGLILLIMSAMPLVNYIISFISINCRVELENRRYSCINMVQAFSLFASQILGAYLWKVVGIASMYYVAGAATIVVAFLIAKKQLTLLKGRERLTKPEKKGFWKISLVSALNNALSLMMFTLDTFLIGIIVADELVIAAYKTATVIPTALSFIPSVLTVYLYPYFARHVDDKSWVKRNLLKSVALLAILNAVIVAVLIIAAPFIIRLIFGEQYLDSVTPFRILSFSYLFSGTLNVLCANIIVSQKKIFFNTIIAVISGLANTGLNILFINLWGSTGAAVATLLVMAPVSIASFVYLLFVLRLGKDGKPPVDGANSNENEAEQSSLQSDSEKGPSEPGETVALSLERPLNGSEDTSTLSDTVANQSGVDEIDHPK